MSAGEVEFSTSRAPIFLQSLRGALGRTPLWLLCWFVPLVAAAALAVPWIGWFDGAVENRYEPGSVLASMDETFRFDHREDLGRLRSTGALAAAPLGLLMVLFGIFSAGGWLQVVLQRTSGRSLRRFLWGGARYFWRFFRLWILICCVLSLAGWLLHGWVWEKVVLDFVFGATDGDLDVLDSERSATWLIWLQAGTFAASVALIRVWGDYTRTRLALHDTSSSIWAGLCTVFLLLRYPIKTLRPFAWILGIEMIVVFALGRVDWGISRGLEAGSSLWAIASLFVLGQLAMMWQSISRGARYYAAVNMSHKLVEPLTQPDPWASRVGGPGGPQYPIDDSDEYGVSL